MLTESFEKIGGVPNEIVTDNMKTVMDIPRTENFNGMINNKFQQFAKDFNFKVNPCIAGRPRTKGKVEATMKILDEIHAYQGKLNMEDIPGFIARINNRLNMTVHTGTRRIPIVELEKEKALLQALPQEHIRAPYKIDHRYLKVNKSNMVTYKSNQYSVPSEYINKNVEVQIYDNNIHVYYNIKLIAQHQITNHKLNYRESDYIETLKVSYEDKDGINQISLENLEILGEMYDE